MPNDKILNRHLYIQIYNAINMKVKTNNKI